MYNSDFDYNPKLFSSKYFTKSDYTILNFICLISLFVFSNRFINVSEKYIMELFTLCTVLPIIIYIKQKKFWTNILLYIFSLSSSLFLKIYFNTLDAILPSIINYSFNLTFATFVILTLFSKYIPERLSLEDSSLIFFSQNLTFLTVLYSLQYNGIKYFWINGSCHFISLIVTICLIFFNINKIKYTIERRKIIFYSMELFINFLNIFLLNISNSIFSKERY